LSLRKFKHPSLPLPPQEYDIQYFAQLIRVINLFFSQINSKTAVDLDNLALDGLTELPNNLPNYSLYRIGRELRIVLPGDTITNGVTSTTEVGSVTVTIS